MFVGAVLLFIGVIYITLSARNTYQAYRFAKEGRTATGTVIKKVMRRARDDGPGIRPTRSITDSRLAAVISITATPLKRACGIGSWSTVRSRSNMQLPIR
jgi:hypothetical protein